MMPIYDESHRLVERAKALGLMVAQQTGLEVKAFGCPDCLTAAGLPVPSDGETVWKQCETCGGEGYLRYRADDPQRGF
jgi:hypothetical protein